MLGERFWLPGRYKSLTLKSFKSYYYVKCIINKNKNNDNNNKRDVKSVYFGDTTHKSKVIKRIKWRYKRRKNKVESKGYKTTLWPVLNMTKSYKTNKRIWETEDSRVGWTIVGYVSMREERCGVGFMLTTLHNSKRRSNERSYRRGP